MRLATASFRGWRRFTHLTITDVPANARLVVLSGPNGNGKSSIFDGFRAWQGRWLFYQADRSYIGKVGDSSPAENYSAVTLSFHDYTPTDTDSVGAAFVYRTAYRIEADFTATAIDFKDSSNRATTINKMSEVDASVSNNYRRLIAQGLAALFGKDTSTRVIQSTLLGPVQQAMRHLFGDLQLENLADPRQGGAFYFSKGKSRQWHYKNLSGGERAAFDLLLDMAVRAETHPNAIYCIDEPETHLNTRVQAALLTELLRLLPPDSQLWIATHSIGMMRAAKARHESVGDVAFIDFEGLDMDAPVTISPVVPDRDFWKRGLQVALDDLAALVSPATVVLVEGRPKWDAAGSGKGNVEFDARCLRRIFASGHPDVDFVSLGGSDDVESDRFKLGATLPLLTPGTQVIRVVDRDERSDDEVGRLHLDGVRVLSRRDLENYLLGDDIIHALCRSFGQPSVGADLIALKAQLLAAESSSPRARAPDDVKNIAGQLVNEFRKRFSIRGGGNTTDAFLSDTMAVLVTPGCKSYSDLEHDIFGQ